MATGNRSLAVVDCSCSLFLSCNEVQADNQDYGINSLLHDNPGSFMHIHSFPLLLSLPLPPNLPLSLSFFPFTTSMTHTPPYDDASLLSL